MGKLIRSYNDNTWMEKEREIPNDIDVKHDEGKGGGSGVKDRERGKKRNEKYVHCKIHMNFLKMTCNFKKIGFVNESLPCLLCLGCSCALTRKLGWPSMVPSAS